MLLTLVSGGLMMLGGYLMAQQVMAPAVHAELGGGGLIMVAFVIDSRLTEMRLAQRR